MTREKPPRANGPGAAGAPIRAVTLDAYGTLFDIDSMMLPAASEIVSRQGLGVSPPALARRWTERFFALLDCYGAGARPRFRTVRELTCESLDACLRELGVRGDVRAGVELWFEHVRRAPLYEEVRAALERLAQRFALAVVSDADDDVLFPPWELARLPVRHVFTSESARAYKIEPGGEIFRRAFEALGVRPEEAVHVGDSASDVVGAVSAGARALWLSRAGASWRAPDCAPDARPWRVARDLSEAAEILFREGARA